MMYSVASVFLLLSVGFGRPRELPRRYLVWGGLLFVAYELCLSLSLGYANSARQAIEVGMVNYLWPTFTILAAILVNGQRSSLLVVPGFALSIVGIGWVLGGEQGLDLPSMLDNLRDNPLSYGLAFSGALLWSAYCTLTARTGTADTRNARTSKGGNGITLFFMLTAAALWIKYLAEGGGDMAFSLESMTFLVLAASAMGFGYAAWNVGILHGNVTFLAGASYFIPILSAALSAVILSTPLSLDFWQGTAMVCAGAILCWLATRTGRGRGRAKAAH